MGGPQTVDNRETAEERARRLEKECLKEIPAGDLLPRGFEKLRDEKGTTLEQCLRENRLFRIEERLGDTTFRIEMSTKHLLIEVASPGKLAKVEKKISVHYLPIGTYGIAHTAANVTESSSRLVGDPRIIDRYLASKGISRKDADKLLRPETTESFWESSCRAKK